MADRLGVTQGYISQIEKGHRKDIRLGFLSEFAKTLGISELDLQVETESLLAEGRDSVLRFYLLQYWGHHSELLAATETLKDSPLFQSTSGRAVLLAYKALALAFLHDPSVKELAGQILDQYDEGPHIIQLVRVVANLCLGMGLLDESEFREADQYFKEAQVGSVGLVDPLIQANVSRQINYYHSMVYSALEQYSEAEQCLAVAEEMDRMYVNHAVKRSADVSYEQARVSSLQGNHEEALAKFERTIDLYRRSECISGVILSMCQVSLECIALENTTRALSVHEDVLSMMRKHPDLVTFRLQTEVKRLATALQIGLMSSTKS